MPFIEKPLTIHVNIYHHSDDFQKEVLGALHSINKKLDTMNNETKQLLADEENLEGKVDGLVSAYKDQQTAIKTLQDSIDSDADIQTIKDHSAALSEKSAVIDALLNPTPPEPASAN